MTAKRATMAGNQNAAKTVAVSRDTATAAEADRIFRNLGLPVPPRPQRASLSARADDQRAEIMKNLGLSPQPPREVARFAIEHREADRVLRNLLPAQSWKGPAGR